MSRQLYEEMIWLDNVANDNVVVDALDQGEIHVLRRPGHLGRNEILVGDLLEGEVGISLFGEVLANHLEGGLDAIRGAVDAAYFHVAAGAVVLDDYSVDPGVVLYPLEEPAALSNQLADELDGDRELVDHTVGVHTVYAAT